MISFKRILVGVAMHPNGKDVGAGGRRATMQAVWLAKQAGATVTLLHSTWCEESGKRRGPTPEVGEALESLASSCIEAGVVADVVYGRQRPWLDMTERALRGDNDMVVVARRDEVDVAAPRLGINAHKLLRNCPCPVWLVHPAHELMHHRALAATDLTPVGARATRLAASLSTAFQCELHIVHAWQWPTELRAEQPCSNDRDFKDRLETIREDVAKRIYAGLDGEGTGIRPQLHMPCNSPSNAIEALLRELDPDLIVMGSVSRSGIPGMLVGNTAERLIYKVGCSLLTVKPDDFVSPVPL